MKRLQRAFVRFPVAGPLGCPAVGRRGPQPKPTAQKKREGTYRADRVAAREPAEAVELPEMPAVVRSDKEARVCWEQLAPLLLQRRTIAVAHAVTLAGLCISYSMLVRATGALARGVVVRRKNTWVPHPAVKIAKDALSELRQYAAHFGLSPASASRVNAGTGVSEAADPAASFLFETRHDGDIVGSIGA